MRCLQCVRYQQLEFGRTKRQCHMFELKLFGMKAAMIWRFMLPGKVIPYFPVLEDNQGAVQLAQNPVTTSSLKHIDVRHHFL